MQKNNNNNCHLYEHTWSHDASHYNDIYGVSKMRTAGPSHGQISWCASGLNPPSGGLQGVEVLPQHPHKRSASTDTMKSV